MSQSNQGLVQSIHTRLLNHAKETKQDFNRILERYGLERFLYRLSKSEYADQFVLKGALMMVVWLGETARPTRDADLLGFGDIDDKALLTTFRDVCGTAVDPDGMSYLADTLAVEDIRENDAYGGRRLALRSELGNADLRIQIDIGIGDAVTPEPEWLEYPSLLNMPAAQLRVYRQETAIAEKLHILVTFGMANSRMKDFFDIAALAKNETFDGALLAEAVRATFERRKTELPAEVPVALTDTFSKDAAKTKQWTAFVSRNGLTTADSLEQTVAIIREFASPIFQALNQQNVFTMKWTPTGPWQ
jgi:predicted nucleotidyltransferase component of viral defense system